MAASPKSRKLSQGVERILVRTGWTQAQLAARLGVTQGHLSKVKRGLAPGSRKLAENLDSIGVTPPRRALAPWLDLVREAGSKSRDAKIAIEAIARVVLKDR